jgi:hypothetical protein
MHQTTTNAVATCRQVSASGHLCGSPALRGKIFCYYHQRDRQRRENIRRALGQKFQNGQEDFDGEIISSLDLPAPDDPVAAGVCLSNTFLALAAGHIPTKRAALMLYNLQIITSNFATIAKYREDFSRAGALASTQALQDLPLGSTGVSPVEDSTQAGRLCSQEVAEHRPDVLGKGAADSRPEGLLHQSESVPLPKRRLVRAVTDPEPVAAMSNPHRQADFMFSEERYAAELETDEPAEIASEAKSAAELAERERNAGLAAHPEGDLPLSDIAPLEPEAVERAMETMSEEGWEKFCNSLWIPQPERDALKQKVVWNDDRAARDATRRLLLKYNPQAVLKQLERLKKTSQMNAAYDEFEALPDDAKATG